MKRLRARRPFLGAALGLLAAWPGVSTSMQAAHAEEAAADDAGFMRLAADREIVALRIEDVDGDGREDLVLLEVGGRIAIYVGRAEGMPAAEPTYTWQAGGDVAWIDVDRRPGRGPALLALGSAGLVRHALPDAGEGTVLDAKAAIDWRPGAGPTFAPLTTRGGDLHVPTATGWRIETAGTDTPLHVPLTLRRWGIHGQGFLEERSTMAIARPGAFVGRAAAGEGRAAYVLAGDRLLEHGSGTLHEFRLPSLPPPADRRLVDVDGDGIPEVLEQRNTNQLGRYTWARPLRTADGSKTLALLGSQEALGFPLEPEFVDLNGDGRMDLVLTAIPIHGQNILRALTAGKATVHHFAYLQKAAPAAAETFPSRPDATLEGEIDVKVGFTFAGTIEVNRSITLCVDADLDGDGRCELIRREGSNLLRSHAGGEGVWQKEPTNFNIPPLGDRPELQVFGADFRGQKRDALVLVYRGSPTQTPAVLLKYPLE